MPHYKDGQAVQIGDVCKGVGYNLQDKVDGQAQRREFVGVVIGIVPDSEVCNLRVAHFELFRSPLQAMPNARLYKYAGVYCSGCSGPPDERDAIHALPAMEYGQCDEFELVHRPQIPYRE